MSFDIQRILPRHFKIIELHLAGMTNVAIAETLDVSAGHVGSILNSPLVRAELNRRQAQIESRDAAGGNPLALEVEAIEGKARMLLRSSAEKAAQVQVDLLDSELCPDPSVRLRASNNILDRVFGAADEEAPKAPAVHISIDVANLLVTALKESTHARTQYSTDRQVIDPERPENQQGNVHEASDSSVGAGPRQASAQGLGRDDSGRNLDAVELLNGEPQLNGSLVTTPNP